MQQLPRQRAVHRLSRLPRGRSRELRQEGDGLFEPAAGKGAVARATFYFLLRYSELRPYSDEAIATLLQWHDAEPVAEYERHRNAGIFERQGNRNPLIDHPEWASRIDFSGPA